MRDHGPTLTPEAILGAFTYEGSDSGYALSTVRAVAEAHGGIVGAANDPDGGGVFSMSIPAAPEPAASA